MPQKRIKQIHAAQILRRHVCVLFFISIMMTDLSVHAALIPFYRMDSLAFQAEAVVLCRELAYEPQYDAQKDMSVDWRIGKYLVQQTLKGGVPAGTALTVRIAGTYRRAVLGDGVPTYFKQKDGKMVLNTVPSIPLGQALLFLKWNESVKMYEPVTGGIKLIIQGKVLGFGQFWSNPGPLVLAPMKQENISVSHYGLAELLADLAVALDRAKLLKAPVRSEPEYTEIN